MSLNQISKVYATAILELAQETNSLESTEEELSTLVDVFFSDESIRHYFLSPLVDPSEKERTAEKSVQGKASEIVANFITLVVRKNRFLFLKDILEDYRTGVDRLKNRSSLRIVSKDSLGKEAVDRITKSITSKFGRDLRVTEQTDPTLIGGFKLFIDDFLIDASIRAKLAGIEEALLQKKIPVGAFE
ncbi:ATP synthase F1 subunit delta [Leptospira bandrabouensis]|uniref:ATP synthase subunit delta n=1 Tax=Leptospira bandrabouensis TaxID=2484903 RepID=A0A6H3NQ04_9LEPT|nr:ATP synthase F1 subunit delta [Leptospira bandrabouensis]MCG6143222.1 ATP synthase F1 subunit delta [Leptospira bandrabouensis]MCG6151744.1 ATP synthase F1 subunit delta [Leptospira bandrabouensis]MCG6158882.1 ATP synthase F1 subunit delta [Leptospira bandrabouensis]MCG6162817.1 ATP synthase F1 subunit delta [Leptospira bandrabouensis]TGN04498.1 ATP synthase F1 subunit delta [Leptospira bandrabouensis]